MLHFKMWWGIAASVAVTWLFGLTHARSISMWMAPEDLNVYYMEEGRSKSIQCIVLVEKSVTVNLTWSGPSINASKPQRISSIPEEKHERVGNWLNITNFSNATAGEYTCRAITSAPNDLSRIITLVKSCDTGKFSPPSCKESCSPYCKPGPDRADGRNCDHINGTCLYGCQEGHAGLKCTECDVERFNHPYCNKSCSAYCKLGPDETKGRNCDHINGTCLSGCQEGYKMPNCTEKTDESGDDVIGGAIGGTIACLLVVGIAVLVVWYIKNRRNKDQRKKETGSDALLPEYPQTCFKAQTGCTLPCTWTTIKLNNIEETTHDGHLDRQSGHYTVPRDGRYCVIFSVDNRDGCLELRKNKSETRICGNEDSLEVTHECELTKDDELYLMGVSGSNYAIRVNVTFSVSFLG